MTNNDKDLLINNQCTIPIKIHVIDGENTTTLTENDIISVSYEDFRYVNTNSLVVGQFVARKVTGELSSINTQFEIEDTEIEIEIGISNNNITNWYSLGNFLVTKPTSDDVKDKTTFEALDYTKKFNQPFDDSNLTYPCTAMELAEEVCRQCGVELGTDSFTNDDFIISDNQYTENDSCRKVMQDIGKLAYSWVRIDWDNKCYIDYEVENSVSDNIRHIIPTNKYYDLNKQNKAFGPVNRVVIGMENVEGENAYVEDAQSIAEYGVTELQIYDNNLTYTPELRQQVIDGARRLFGLTYLPLEVNTVGHPWLIGKEKIGVVDANGDTLYTYPFDRTIEYKGHIKTKLTSKAETKIETEYKNTGTLENEMRKTRIIVDKQNQTINALVEKVVPVSNTISGVGSITLENAYVGTLHRLEITGAIKLLFPDDNLYPSDDLYPLDTNLIVDGDVYHLDFTYLNYINSQVCDKYVYEDKKQWVERNVGVDGQGNLYPLTQPIIEYSDNILEIQVDNNSTISMESFENPRITCTYLLQNDYTNTFVPDVDVISRINLSEGTAQIDATKLAKITADKIALEGYTTINENFGVDLEGNMFARNGSFSGDIYLNDGNIVVGGDGLFTNLQYISTGRFNGYELLGYNFYYGTSGVINEHSDISIDIDLPDNFKMLSAYLTIYHTPVYWNYFDQSTQQSGNVWGYSRNIRLYKSDDNTNFQLYMSGGNEYRYEFDTYSLTEIQNAFVDGSFNPTNTSGTSIVTEKTIDLKSYINQQGKTKLVLRNGDNIPSSAGQIAEYTGMGKAVVDILGYISFDKEG